ncbi:MAG: PQQ-dependent sugar dehydrogenase [Nitrososphaeraceae archaeon]
MGPISLNNNDSVTKLFSLNGSYYSDPKFTWTIPIGVTAIEFFNSSILGKEYENNIFVGDINNGNLYYFRINDKDNRTSLSIVNDFHNDGNINQQYYGLDDLVADNKEEAAEVLFAGNFKGRITDIKTGPDGYLYVLTYYDGKIYKIMPLG